MMTPQKAASHRPGLRHTGRPRRVTFVLCEGILLGSEDDEHGTPFKLGHLLYRRDVCSLFGDTGKQLASQGGEGNFTPAEHAGYLDLVLLADKLFDVTDLGLQVMVTCLGPHLDLLHLEGALLLLGLLALFGLFVLKSTKIHDLAYRRIGVRRHLNKIQTAISGQVQCLLNGKHAKLGSVGTDNADFSRSDLVVDVDSAAVSYVLLLVVSSLAYPSAITVYFADIYHQQTFYL